MGADAFAGLKSWRGAAGIPFVAPLIVASRPGFSLEEFADALPKGLTLEGSLPESTAGSAIEVRAALLRNAAGNAAPLYLLPGLHVDVSASEIRRQVRAVLDSPEAEGWSLSGLVAEYIRSHGLYL